MIDQVQAHQEHLELKDGRSVSAAFYQAGKTRLNAGFALAHGAGAGQTSPFIRDFAYGLAERGINVLTFNFPYMETKRRIPDRAEILEASFEAAVEKLQEQCSPEDRIFIGGKSMGGRIASQLAARADFVVAGLSRVRQPGSGEPGQNKAPVNLAGLVLLGYPLHPPGRPDQLRTAHLARLELPILIVQGTRDVFGTPDEIRPWFSGPNATIHPVEGGDHSFKIRKGSSSRSQDEVYAEIQDKIRDWIGRVEG